MPKMNVNLYVIEDYENELSSGPKKQTQTNPISKQLQGKRCFRWIREFINW